MNWLDLKIFGSGYGLSAPDWDQPFYWLVDSRTRRGQLYTYSAGFGAQLISFQWTHPRAQETRTLAGLNFRPFNSDRVYGRVRVSWAVQIGRHLRPEDFALIKYRLSYDTAYRFAWGGLPGEQR